MNRHTYWILVAAMATTGSGCVLTDAVAQVAKNDGNPAATSPASPPSRTLISPVQLSVIRGISRNVLAAKKNRTANNEDVVQLAELRTELDALIAAELEAEDHKTTPVEPNSGASVRRENMDASAQGPIPPRMAAMHAAGRDLASKLNRRAKRKNQFHLSRPDSDLTGNEKLLNGFPLTEQRTHLFDRWGKSLDAALAAEDADRVVQLQNLRNSLNAVKEAAYMATPIDDTPTFRTMRRGVAHASGDRQRTVEKK